jgi:hypothetical protein
VWQCAPGSETGSGGQSRRPHRSVGHAYPSSSVCSWRAAHAGCWHPVACEGNKERRNYNEKHNGHNGHHGTHNALRTTTHNYALRTPPVHTYHAANHTTRNARAHVLRTFDTSFNVKCTRTWDSSSKPGSRTSTPREVPMLKCPDTNAAVWNVYLLLKPMRTGGPAQKVTQGELRSSQLRAGDRRGFDRGSSSSTGWCWVRATERRLCLLQCNRDKRLGHATGTRDCGSSPCLAGGTHGCHGPIEGVRWNRLCQW